VNAALGSAATKSDIGFLLNLRVQRVEGLRHVVVEGSRCPVVLLYDVYHCPDFLGLCDAFALFAGIASHDSWMILKALLASLLCVLSCFDREVVGRLIARLETPVGSISVSLLFLIILSKPRVVILPGNSAGKEVPIEVTIKRDESAEAPKDPTSLTDHPYVGLTHVVRDVEHHLCNYYYT
jgi:hypothetical protein